MKKKWMKERKVPKNKKMKIIKTKKLRKKLK